MFFWLFIVKIIEIRSGIFYREFRVGCFGVVYEILGDVICNGCFWGLFCGILLFFVRM